MHELDSQNSQTAPRDAPAFQIFLMVLKDDAQREQIAVAARTDHRAPIACGLHRAPHPARLIIVGVGEELDGIAQEALESRTAVADLGAVVIGGCAVALVSFADTSVLSRAYAAKTRMYVDPNQEMIGLGVANLAAGFFKGFPISSSSSRTPVAEASGARTQLTGVVGAVAIALLLLLAPNLMQNLPTGALAAVVIAAALGLFEIGDLCRIYRVQRWEFWLSMVCLAGVAVLGAIPGVTIPAFAITAIWMLAAMIVAVRQALDYTSTGRAIAVCVIGWLLALAFAVIVGLVFGPTVT